MPEETLSKPVASPTNDNAVLPEKAALANERLTSLVNSMADGVLATDENLIIVLSNGAALNILDVNDTLSGKRLRDVLRLQDKNNQPIDIEHVVHETKTQFTNRDWRLAYADNSTINLYLSVAAVKLGYGHQGTKGYVILLRDITREKSLEEERDEFISVVSHELRTPIAISEGNISNAQLIFEKSGINDPKITETLKQAHEQINFLSSMINDLATLSRAERGKLTVEVETINAHELCTELATNYTPQAKQKGLEFKLELDPTLEILQSSKLYVREILDRKSVV